MTKEAISGRLGDGRPVRDYVLLDAGAGWELRARRTGSEVLIEKWSREGFYAIPGTSLGALGDLARKGEPAGRGSSK